MAISQSKTGAVIWKSCCLRFSNRDPIVLGLIAFEKVYRLKRILRRKFKWNSTEKVFVYILGLKLIRPPLVFLNLSVIKKLLYIILITEFRSNATFVFKTKTRNIKIKILLCDTEILWILEL